MGTSKLPGGLWPVMLTPFLENNEIDYPGLKKLTDFYINTGGRSRDYSLIVFPVKCFS